MRIRITLKGEEFIVAQLGDSVKRQETECEPVAARSTPAPAIQAAAVAICLQVGRVPVLIHLDL